MSDEYHRSFNYLKSRIKGAFIMKTKIILLLLVITCTVAVFMPQEAPAQTRRTYRVYIVQKGDSIWKICRNYNGNFSNTLRINTHFKNPNLIYPGDKVYLPKNNTTQPEDNQDNNMQEPESQPEETKPINTSELKKMEQEVIKLVNAERQKLGLKDYQANSQLSNIARNKSQDMRDNNYFSHTSPTYGSPFEMLRKFNVNYSAAGENIAKGQRTAQAVINAWMNSAGHRRNILSKKYTQIGVGLVKDNQGVTYWTQLFIRP